MTQTEPWTISRLLTWTTDYFKKSGSASARLDAEVLLAHACHCERIELYTAFDTVPEDNVRVKFREFVKRRGEGTPVAYLVGYREFYSLNFKVTHDVLVPRPETEFLVVTAIDLVKNFESDGQAIEIADIGTGSGAIAVTVAKHVEQGKLTATDISQEAIEVASENAAQHGVSERITFVNCDLMSGIEPNRRFDLILSNPPYIGENERQSLPPDVRDHEPPQALFAGPDGTDVIRRLIPTAAQYLRPGGWLAMEISPQIEASVCELIRENGEFEAPSLTKDLSGFARVVQCRRLEANLRGND
jgi:release factor glutamine methyltransferase